MRVALVLAVLFAISCKKEPPKGDLPPAGDWNSGSAAGQGPAAPPPPNPHGAAPPAGNPHGGGAMPGGKTEPRTPEKLADGKIAIGPFSVAAPADWTIKPTTSASRAAQFALGKDGDAELIVYYFGPGGAGSVQDNLDRWVDQIKQPDGKSSREVAKIEKAMFGGQNATTVSVAGRYTPMAMPGGPEAVEKADQVMLGAIVESPNGPYYFKLVGAKATVDANAGAFRTMLESLKIR